MKNILALIVFVFSFQLGNSQNIIEDNFSHLMNQEDGIEIAIDGKLFAMAENFKNSGDEDTDEMIDFISTITNFRAIGFEELSTADREYKSRLASLTHPLEELMIIRSKGANFSLYIDETDGVVHELVGIGQEGLKFGVFSLTGRMDLKQVGKMATELQMEGLEKMESIKDYDISDVNVYPNPISRNGVMTIETPSQFDGATATIIDEQGKVVKSLTIDRPSQDILPKGLNSGIYIVDITKGEVSVRKKVIILD